MRGKSVTLIELLIAITLISLVVLGFSSIDLFSRHHLLTIDRRARIQNDVSYILEHMTKEIAKAIGNESVYGARTVVNTTAISGDTAIRVYVDYNRDAQRNSGDRWIAYKFTGASGNDRHQMQYCPQCTNNPCTQCNPAWSSSANMLSRKITAFTSTYSSSNNYVDIQLTACWDPDGARSACNSPDNPAVTMRNRIKMPSVSTH